MVKGLFFAAGKPGLVGFAVGSARLMGLYPPYIWIPAFAGMTGSDQRLIFVAVDKVCASRFPVVAKAASGHWCRGSTPCPYTRRLW